MDAGATRDLLIESLAKTAADWTGKRDGRDGEKQPAANCPMRQRVRASAMSLRSASRSHHPYRFEEQIVYHPYRFEEQIVYLQHRRTNIQACPDNGRQTAWTANCFWLPIPPTLLWMRS
jgi:hypothetical protein